MQLIKMVSITNVLNNEWVNTRIPKRRIELNGERIKQAREELNRKIVLFRLTTTKTYAKIEFNGCVFFFEEILRILSDNTNRFLR